MSYGAGGWQWRELYKGPLFSPPAPPACDPAENGFVNVYEPLNRIRQCYVRDGQFCLLTIRGFGGNCYLAPEFRRLGITVLIGNIFTQHSQLGNLWGCLTVGNECILHHFLPFS